MTADPYQREYPGYWTMMSHDGDNELRRWFYNYALDRHTQFAADFQYLTIEEITFTHRGRRCVRYVGTIGEDGTKETRKVTFETNAPPPPTFWRAAQGKRPPPRRPDRYETEMMMRMQERWRREIYGPMMMNMLRASPFFIGMDIGSEPDRTVVTSAPPPPPPPRYRRNA